MTFERNESYENEYHASFPSPFSSDELEENGERGAVFLWPIMMLSFGVS
ncbi:hypothetical protein U0X36_05615 [Bacillus thuringiensis]|nr:hypothetical protein [Bacillus thuringiensis]MDZ3952420.1 hypothetical protein [Bacillus thuringiensis]